MNKKQTSSLRRIIFVAVTLTSIGASAVATEVPPECAHVAQLANQGQLAEAFNTLESDAALGIRCEFEIRDAFVFALTRYERLVRAAGSGDIWATAFTLGGIEYAEMLLERDRQIPQTIEFLPPLTWAIVHERAEAIEWLLELGADVNADRPANMPLVRAVWLGNWALAERLIDLGADPLPLANQIYAMNEVPVEQQGVLIVAALRRVGSIPESVIHYAVIRNPALLDDLAQTRLKVQLETRDWHEGRRTRIPEQIRSALNASGKLQLTEKVDRLYKAGTLPPKEQIGVLTYGTTQRGARLQRYHDRRLNDEEMLIFATALCIHFFDANCGPPRLQRAARGWVKQLPYKCPDDARHVLSPAACKVMMYYADRDNLPWYRGLAIDKVNGRIHAMLAPSPELQAALKRMYVEKHQR